MKAVTDTQHYDDIAKSINYTRSDVLYKSDLTRAREEIALDNDYFEDIGEAIVTQDGGTTPEKSQMAARILALPITKAVTNPALVLWDWEGTKLAEYSAEDALALTELPAPSTLPAYTTADHELLLFQEWNWSLAAIKAWLQAHEGETLDVGAIYTTTDGQDHNYWGSPRLDAATTINMQKRGTTSIGIRAFQNCYSLTRINIPDGVTSIGSSTFQSCYSLTQISIPDGVTSIGYMAFRNCYSLIQINIPDSVTSIGTGAFQECFSLTQINIPDSVTSIDRSAFSSCFSLTQINIPDGVTSIGDYAFNGCFSLTQINIPDGVTSIEGYAFYGCNSLTQINIPDSVTSIGDQSFENCISLCDILNESRAALSGANAFFNLPTNYRIYVPRADLSWFETATNWATIYTQGHIVAIEDNIAYLESIGFNVDAYKGA